ncbi:MAG: permease component of ribose/xylose/arabinose/galactoside ABC-type transporter [Firmicutes bacterium]|nr:permease component of ribose/xylose/arabinose/galactoside ABC-type transporter [Bacillota bacterium]
MKLAINNIGKNTPWIWACLGSLICWLLTSLLLSKLDFQSLLVNAALASLLTIVSLGQMFAMTSGDGGIDLSIPYTITLSAFLSFGIIQGSESNLILGMSVVAVVGIVIGFLNAISIITFKIPPIIATMAIGFIVNSGVLVYSSSFTSNKTSAVLTTIANGRLLGIPIIILFAIALILIITFVFEKMSYGRAITAVGQNRLAAFFAGINVNRTIMLAYMISGLLAAVGGALIGARIDGAFLEMGQSYMLQSVGAVVIGGTLVSGGKASTVGTAFGALMLTLMVTLMVISRLPIGVQYIIEGIILILVLIIDKPHTESD